MSFLTTVSGRRRLHLHRYARLVSTILLVILALSSWPSLPSGDAVGQGVGLLQITGPSRVQVGEPITFTVTGKGVASLGGYEATILFNTDVAEFHTLEQGDNDLNRLFGRDVEPLAALEMPYGATIGSVSCPVRSCVDRRGPRRDSGGQGTVQLASVSLLPYEPGVLEVKFDAIKVVKANGIALPVSIPPKTFNVQVGSSRSGPHFSAPTRPWTLPTTQTGPVRPVDITRSGDVTYTDLMAVTLDWYTVRERGAPCGNLPDPALDINGDSCIDVADLQLVVSQLTLAGSANDNQNGDPNSLDDAYTLQQTATKTFVVNTTVDQGDVNIGNGICATSAGTCTLRAALQEANNDNAPSKIEFNIPGAGPHTIVLNDRLPDMQDNKGPTTIDGHSQPGASPNSDSSVSNAAIMIQVEGAGESQFRGIAITTPDNVIQGIAWYKFNRSIWIVGQNATNNRIVGNFVGTNASGTYGASSIAPEGVPAHGIHIVQGAKQNWVGGTTHAERNVISGNGRTGVSIWHGGSNGNRIYNNLIGLRPNGTACRVNRLHGVDMNHGASNNLVGGTATGQRNVITGNDYAGVDISHSTSTTGNQVIGNYIGTNVTGASTISGCTNRWGMRIKDGVRFTTVSDNVIVGSSEAGIEFQGPPTPLNDALATNNTVTRNRIGITTNDTARSNAIGILLNGRNNTIGPDNIIAHNSNDGVRLVETDSDFNTITRNSIRSNGGKGIRLTSGANESIGTPNLQSATTSQAVGTACGGCTVEVFIATGSAGQQGQGRTYVGSGVAGSNGAFTVPVGGVPSNAVLTSTATNSSGNTSEFSINLAVSGTGNPPAAPSELTAMPVSSTQVDLTWTNNADNADNVVVERSLDEAVWETLETLAANATSHSDATVSAEVTYFYRVVAVNSFGSSGPSNIASATTPPTATAPAAPSELTASTVSASQIDLAWTNNADNEDNLVIERSFDQVNWSVLATLAADATSHSDVTVRINTTYFYRVIAINTGGNSDPSNTASANTATALPGRVEAEDYREGGAGFGYNDTTTGNTGGAYRSDNVDLQSTQDIDGGFNVGWVAAGEWLAFDTSVATDGPYSITFRVATIHNNRTLRLEIDGQPLTGSVAIPKTGGWQSWTSVTVGPFDLTAGTHTLTFVAETDGFNINYFDVAEAASDPSETVFALPARIQAEDYRSGGPDVGFHDTTAGNTGGAYRSDDVDIQATQDSNGDFNVGWIDAGEWLAYDVEFAESGNYLITVREASPNNNRQMRLVLDDENMTGSISVPNTGGWQSWTNVTVGPVSIQAGNYTLKVVAETNGFNVNYLEFSTEP